MALPASDVLKNPRDWARVEAIASRVLDAAEQDRAGILDAECPPGDPLREAVERILDAARASRNFLEEPASQHLGEPRLSLSGEPRPPPRLGPYALLRRLGQGGMSQVWLAKRADGAFDRRVAIKWLPTFAGRESLARLDAERRILALVEHPHVARLYDGGVDDAGHPYLVTELVDGEPIDVHCARRRLSLRQRLELVLDLCSAVAAVHRHGLVHRDLKPANVLVTHDGVVKLVDFGIARPLQAIRGLETSLTRTGGRPMTPGYASPEQVKGERITPTTDIHGLGLVLFELATGRRAYARAGTTLYQVERLITEGATPRASEAMLASKAAEVEVDGTGVPLAPPESPLELRRMLAAHLDAVIARALAKDPAGRQPSADELSRQIARARDGVRRSEGRRSEGRRAPRLSRIRHGLSLLAVLAAPLLLAGRPASDSHTLPDPIVLAHLEATAETIERAARSRTPAVLLPLVPASEQTSVALARAVSYELRRHLVTVPGLRLVGTTSSERSLLAGDPATAATYLAAKIYLRGDVEARGDQLRARLQAVRSADGHVLFAGEIDTASQDLGRRAAAWTADLARALGLAAPADDTKEHWNRGAEEEMAVLRLIRDQGPQIGADSASAHIRRAFEADPESPAAKMTLARRKMFSNCQRGAAAFESRRLLREILAARPRSSEAWTLTGMMAANSWDWRGAARALRQALELDSSNSEAMRTASVVALGQGQIELALKIAEQSVAIDPLSALARYNHGFILSRAGRFDQALLALRQAQALRPNLPRSSYLVSTIHLAAGRTQAARDAALRETDETFRLFAEALVRGPRDTSTLESLVEHSGTMAYQIAELWAAHGQAAETLHWLSRAEAQGDCGLSLLSTDPRMAVLADDPRLGELMMRLGLAGRIPRAGLRPDPGWQP